MLKTGSRSGAFCREVHGGRVAGTFDCSAEECGMSDQRQRMMTNS